ncbi:phage tail protein [Achromobacter sp. Marseille-Q0513]|uniref:phage tail protein n=1 Tax=Achromobacter sp. Marseille-Q0513 TaxID=2829161 RepID=UPI001B9BE6D2|nr:phage tail protein [Achromobacter sp. Marseille-Q0513]MBR8657438.1 phage tail protein [Achromobacter sp. Marseille-Q0513]
MHKSVFQTDDDGLFLYETVANDLPLSPGAYNVPFGAYPDAPPAGGSGRWPRWTGNGWQMVEDHRATPLWVAETGESYAIGSKIKLRGGVDDVRYPGWGPLPAWLSDTAPPRPAESAGV